MDITVKRKGMKKKGRGSEEAKKNSDKRLLTLCVVMAAVLVSSVLVAFVPTAAVDAISFTIEPETSGGCEVKAYDVEIEYTTGFTSLDMTIPAGFGAVPPGDGDLIAEISLLDDGGNKYDINLTANGTDKIDLVCVCGDDVVEYTFGASYGEGDTIEVTVACWGNSTAKLTLPKSDANGSLKLESASKTITDVDISIKEFVKNPTMCGDYEFDLTVNGNGDTASATVHIVGGKPDLVITDKWIEGNKIWYTIKNEGCAAARRSYTGLYIGGEYKTRDRVGGLASGENSTESFRYKWTKCTPSGSNITVTVCADYRERIEECNETNNCREQIEVCPQNWPDLVIDEKWEEWTGEPGYYKVHFVVKNIGVATAPKGHNATLTVDKDGANESIQHKVVPRALRPGRTYKSYFEELVNCTGENDTIEVCADDDDDIQELNETNNCLENVWSCEMKPDLVIVDKSEKERRGNKYKVYFVVKNIGTVTTEGVYYANLTVNGVEIDDKRIRRALKPGKTYKSSFRKRVDCPEEGDFDIIEVCADYSGFIDELNETNNCRVNEWECPG